jgi:hypothetical protein
MQHRTKSLLTRQHVLSGALAAQTASLLLTACSAERHTGEDETQAVRQGVSASPGTTPSQPASAADETQQIQDLLDARYKTSDVRYSFETMFGETIDCIDYYSQPGARSLMRAGKEVPKPLPAATYERSSLPDYMFNGKPDRRGNARACPNGTVPMLRITVDDVRASGGLASRRLHSPKRPPPGVGTSNPAPEVAGHAHIVQMYTGNANITRTKSNMAVYAPSVLLHRFSLSQTWTFTGTGHNIPPESCTTDCAQTVEAGWVVDPVSYNNNNPNAPHLFTYATNDGYVTGCWNNDPTRGTCLGWVGQSSSPFSLGMTLPSSVSGGTQVDIQIAVQYVSGSGWCLSVWNTTSPPSGNTVGCWPSSDFTGTMQTAATYFQVGGEVYDALGGLAVPMGSGSLPNAGYGRAAFHHDFAVYVSNGWVYTGFVPREYLAQLSYGMETSVAPGSTSWVNWFYFGNEPLIGWQTSGILLN